MNSKSRIISTDEDPSLRIESSAIINLRGVSTKLNKYINQNCSVIIVLFHSVLFYFYPVIVIFHVPHQIFTMKDSLEVFRKPDWKLKVLLNF